MFIRTIQEELIELARQYPIVSLMGPRQSGKTTIVREVFVDKPYVNFERPDIRLLAETDPISLLEQYPHGAILDEVQRVPVLISYLQVIVDEAKSNGMFIITGSHQIELHSAVSQSLAGRVGLLNLYPMTMRELKLGGINLDLDEQIYKGFFPRIYSENLNPSKAYRNYLQTYIEKDVRQISEIKNLVQFQTFIKLCAGRIGQILDYTSLGNAIGVSNNTVKHWLSVLEASYIVFRLQPYFENFGKRLIKSPKLYFTDVGLAAYLLGIETPQQISRDPLRGQLVENLVIMEMLKYCYNRGVDPNIYYFRDSHQNEVDVIIKRGNQLIPVEIKSAKTFTKSFLKGLRYYKELVGDRAPEAYLIYAGDQSQVVAGIKLLHYSDSFQVFGESGGKS